MQGCVDSFKKDQKNEGKRGAALRELTRFLKKHDPEETYAGLARICQEKKDPVTGAINPVAIWTTDEGKRKLEHEQVRHDCTKEMKQKYDKQLKEKLNKRRNGKVSPSKLARQRLREQMKEEQSIENEFEAGSPLGVSPIRNNMLEPITPLKKAHDENLAELEELTMSIEDLTNIKPRGTAGTVLKGELYCRKAIMLGLVNSNKQVTARVRGDGILTYDNLFFDLSKVDASILGEEKDSVTFVIKQGGTSVTFKVKEKDQNASDWIEAIKKWDVDNKMSEDFATRIEAMRSKISDAHKSRKKLMDELAASESEDELEMDTPREEGEEEAAAEFSPTLQMPSDIKSKLEEGNASEMTTGSPAVAKDANAQSEAEKTEGSPLLAPTPKEQGIIEESTTGTDNEAVIVQSMFRKKKAIRTVEAKRKQKLELANEETTTNLFTGHTEQQGTPDSA